MFKRLGGGAQEIIENRLYSYYPTTLIDSATGDIKGLQPSSKLYGMLFKTNNFEKDFWTSSKFSNVYYYGIYNTTRGRIAPAYLKSYGGNRPEVKRSLVPIVYLDSDISLEYLGTKNNCDFWDI